MFKNCDCSSNMMPEQNTIEENNVSNEIYETSCNTKENDISNEIYQTSCNIDNNSFDNTNSCSCGFDDTSAFPSNYMYGHSYVPHQKMNKVYTPEMGLKMGTIFPELVSPYCPGQSLEVMNYLKNSNTIGGGCNS